ncbi:MAG: TVP38/TMEM64 family protein [Thermoanaerobaculia bacterium]
MSRKAIKVALVAFISAVVIALYFTPLRQYMTREHIHTAVATMRSLWYAPILLIAGYALGCVFALPASIFVIAAGVIFGWKFGTVYAMTGAMIGATASYFVGRFLGEGILDRMGKTGARLAHQSKNAGFLSILIVRLIPGPPFALWNYAAGVARVPVRDYVLGTLIGTLPAHIIFTYSADAIFNGSMSEGAAMKRLFIVAGLLLAMVIVPLLLTRWLERAGDRPSEV